MADKKISQLTGASTPLAGTEVLPIVQSGSTVKVASDDLTVKNVRANATTGILQVTGPAAASTRVMTVPNADFTVARTDAANSFTGDQTLATGSLGIGVAPGVTLDVTGANAKIRLQPTTGTNDAQSRIQNTGGIFVRGVDDSAGSGFGAGAYAGVLWHSGARNVVFGTNDVQRARIPSVGGFVVGPAALTTTATDGFLYVPTCAGTPTGVPTTQTGTAPIVVDTTNNKLYFYSGGVWRDAGP